MPQTGSTCGQPKCSTALRFAFGKAKPKWRSQSLARSAWDFRGPAKLGALHRRRLPPTAKPSGGTQSIRLGLPHTRYLLTSRSAWPIRRKACRPLGSACLLPGRALGGFAKRRRSAPASRSDVPACPGKRPSGVPLSIFPLKAHLTGLAAIHWCAWVSSILDNDYYTIQKIVLRYMQSNLTNQAFSLHLPAKRFAMSMQAKPRAKGKPN